MLYHTTLGITFGLLNFSRWGGFDCAEFVAVAATLGVTAVTQL